MARKGKVGIDYFSHDVDMLSDRKIKLLKAKHGLVGYAVYLRLLEELYQDKGYYLEINEDFNILFSDDNNLDLNVYILILNDCINHELFDIKIFEKYSILTSKRIQINYLTACERRKGIDIYSEYLLFDTEDVNIKTDNVNILALNADIGTQSKKKEKIEDNENENKKENMVSAVLECYDAFDKLPKYKTITDARKKSINARVEDHGIDTVKEVIRQAAESNFLFDSIKSNWYNFDWLFNPNNFVKVLEGKYDNKQQTQPAQQQYTGFNDYYEED